MKGKIVSISKVMNNGQHATWSSDRGTFYKHNLTVESGGNQLIGEASTKNTDAAYGSGDEIEFEFTTDARGNKFKGVKKLDAGGKEKSYGANMDHVARQAAAKTAIELCSIFSQPVDNKTILAIIPVFHTYLKKTDNREEIYARIAALNMVVDMKKNDQLKDSIASVKSPLQIVATAEKFEEWIVKGIIIPEKFE